MTFSPVHSPLESSQSPIRRGGRPATQRPRRLICFPPAGAGASLYYPWIDRAPGSIEVCSVALPGREDRMRESPASSVESLAGELAQGLIAELDRAYCLFGYSLGALLAYETALELQRLGLPAPQCIVTLAARGPGSLPRAETQAHLLSATAFRKLLRDVGGTPAEILDNPAAMELFEPILRNDFRIAETYQRTPLIPLNCPILSFHCEQDTLIEEDEVRGWRDCTSFDFCLKTLAEAHMVVQDTFMTLPDKIDHFWNASQALYSRTNL